MPAIVAEQRKEGYQFMKKKCVIYARVSSREQKENGYSTEAQIALLKSYAQKNGSEIVEIDEDVETAKKTGRKKFTEMIKFLKKNKSVNTLLVEKNDRLYRNFRDYVTIDEIERLEVHLVKENSVLGENSRSHDKFIHGIFLKSKRLKTCCKKWITKCPNIN